MRIYTGRYQSKWLADWPGTKIGITLGVPRFKLGYTYRRLRMLAPDHSMFGKSHEEFTALYRGKLDSIGLDAILDAVEQVAEGQDACLLCFENVEEGGFCHRTILAQWMTERGIPVEELPDPAIPATTQAA
jgi:hypothetical protein